MTARLTVSINTRVALAAIAAPGTITLAEKFMAMITFSV
jgi:hypothetical protein